MSAPFPPQVLTREGALMTQPEYVLRFQPPLTISNLLPFDITVVITDRCASLWRESLFSIGAPPNTGLLRLLSAQPLQMAPSSCAGLPPHDVQNRTSCLPAASCCLDSSISDKQTFLDNPYMSPLTLSSSPSRSQSAFLCAAPR